MLFSVIKKTLAVASAIPALTATLPVGHLEVGVTALKLTRRNEVFQQWLTDLHHLPEALERCLSLCRPKRNSNNAATAQVDARRTAPLSVDASAEKVEAGSNADLKVAAVEPAAAAVGAAVAEESAAALAAALAANAVASAVNGAAVEEAAAAGAEAAAANVAAGTEAAAEAVAEDSITDTAITHSIAHSAPHERIGGGATAAATVDASAGLATVVAPTAENAAKDAPFKLSFNGAVTTVSAAQKWIEYMVTKSAGDDKPWKNPPSLARALARINGEPFDNRNPNCKWDFSFTASQKADIVEAVRTSGRDEYRMYKYNGWNGNNNKFLFSDNDILGLVKGGNIKIKDLDLDYDEDDRSRITKSVRGKGGKRKYI